MKILYLPVTTVLNLMQGCCYTCCNNRVERQESQHGGRSARSIKNYLQVTRLNKNAARDDLHNIRNETRTMSLVVLNCH